MASPAWLSKELFESALKRLFQEKEVTILGYNCTSVVPAGDNYTSDLFRASVTFKRASNGNKDVISIIVKSSPRGGIMEELAKDINLFEKEIHMFSKVLPKIYEKLGKTPFLSSSCYYVHYDGPHSLLLLEDLKLSGYEMMQERQVGFDLQHCKLILKNMAKLHATSFILYQEDPSLITKIYKDGLFCDHPMIKQWMEMSFKTCHQYFLTDHDLKKYAIKMENLTSETFVQRALDSSKKNLNSNCSTTFNVLNHGDLWVNNAMFKYSPDVNGDNKLKDMRFVDFQLCKFSSPAVDLHYFFATSLTIEGRKKENIKYMLDYYYANFLKNVTNLGMNLEDVPSRKEFIKDFNNRSTYGLVASLCVGSLVKADHRKDANFEDLMSKEGPGSFREHCFTNPHYKAMMKQLLPFYDSLGALD